MNWWVILLTKMQLHRGLSEEVVAKVKVKKDYCVNRTS